MNLISLLLHILSDVKEQVCKRYPSLDSYWPFCMKVLCGISVLLKKKKKNIIKKKNNHVF